MYIGLISDILISEIRLERVTVSAQTLEIAQRGQMTIPKSLRDKYGLKAGRKMTLIDLGGYFVLSPSESRIDVLCDSLRDDLLDSGATLEEMLAELHKMRATGER